ncbi:hypothetical protein ACFYKX_02745 [Cytobacillus sp. FJAT-54145]|uniref:Lipoprotein n=1 Tax=Cytobacillus spartinae TaxID=3299023 RepID=A0ABW6K5U7_9BACI
MRLLNSFLFCVLCSFLLISCNTVPQEKLYSMPEEMPESFGFHVKYGIGMKNEINTYEGAVVKDLIAKGTHKTTDIVFTEEEMKNIYEMVRQTEPFSPKYLAQSNSCNQTPYNEFYIEITVENHTTNFHFSEEYCELTDDGKKFKSLIYKIHDLLQEKEEYKQLPQAEGGYD